MYIVEWIYIHYMKNKNIYFKTKGLRIFKEIITNVKNFGK
jgi:hypothetical protein